MMTFQQMMEKTPQMYDGLAIDEGTQSALLDWFGFREVCDDDRFSGYYRRKLNIVSDQYNNLLRIQKTQFDPMVSNYVERLLEHVGNVSRETSGTLTMKKGAGSITTSTRTPDLTTTDTHASGGSDTTTSKDGGSDKKTSSLTIDEKNETAVNSTETTSGTDSSRGTDTTTDKTAEAQKTNPQSISYSGATAGEIPSLDWSYMSGQRQTEGSNSVSRETSGENNSTVTREADASDNYTQRTGTNSGTDTTTYGKTGEDKMTYGRTDNGTQKTTGTDTTETTVTQTGEDTNTNSGTDKTSSDNTDKIRETGRTGILPQEALGKARDYIMGTNAFLWLIGQLDPCFMGFYEI